MITKPGVYQIPIEEYVADPCVQPSLSASAAHTLLTRSARHCWIEHPKLNTDWKPEEPTTDSDIGTAVHALLLENVSAIHVVDAENWRTADARAVRVKARENGLIPLLTKDNDRVRAIVREAKAAIHAAPELRAAFAAGKPELTYLWQEGETWCRTRPDWVTNDYRLIVDVKTTSASAEPDSWGRGQMLRLGYDLQGAFQLRAIKHFHQPKTCSFINLVVETDEPYGVAFVGLNPEFEDFAERKRQAALLQWRHCLDSGAWPGYPNRICYVDPPAYALARWEEARIGGGSTEDL